MARGDHQLRVRLPAPVMEAVEKAAAEMGRSLNAEIVARLERSYGVGEAPNQAPIPDALWTTYESFVRSLIELRPGGTLKIVRTEPNHSDTPAIDPFAGSSMATPKLIVEEKMIGNPRYRSKNDVFERLSSKQAKTTDSE